jgi:hypothetical protein
MKSSEVRKTGTKLSFWRSVSILLVFAAFAASNAKAAAPENQSSGAVTDVRLSQTLSPDDTSFDAWGTLPDVGVPTLFVQQGAPWCYTNVGRFPMQVSLPAGVSCYVTVPYWPYTLYGTTGF